MSKKLTCVFVDPTGPACRLELCQTGDLAECCDKCPKYIGPDRGLGDLIKRGTDSLGIKTCGGCQKRRQGLNEMTRKAKALVGYSHRNKQDDRP
tara:strand:+ start:2630 stop:2911 length:282 start_codon:yes stop_codon:yes gene_type:complete